MILTVVSSVATGEHEIVGGRQEDGMIDSFKFGQIVVDGKTYTSDVIVFPDRVDDTCGERRGITCVSKILRPLRMKHPRLLWWGQGWMD